jgi:hypothetical protein
MYKVGTVLVDSAEGIDEDMYLVISERDFVHNYTTKIEFTLTFQLKLIYAIKK